MPSVKRSRSSASVLLVPVTTAALLVDARRNAAAVWSTRSSEVDSARTSRDRIAADWKRLVH
jgi:hypothetical protein